METVINKISPTEIEGSSYKGQAIYTTANLIIEALGIEPSVWDNCVCEWYLQHNGFNFSIYSDKPVKGDDVTWFRIGAFSKAESIEILDFIMYSLKSL